MTTLLTLAVGYCAAVIFPVPWLSRAILDGWAKVLGQIENVKAKYTNPPSA